MRFGLGKLFLIKKLIGVYLTRNKHGDKMDWFHFTKWLDKKRRFNFFNKSDLDESQTKKEKLEQIQGDALKLRENFTKNNK